MLSDGDRRYISERLGIYDHEWRAYVPVLGEPFLLDDHLVYFDGACLYVCAYKVGDTQCLMDRHAVAELVSRRADFATVEAVALWGRFDAFDELTIGAGDRARTLRRVTFTDFDAARVDSVIELAAFSFDDEREARHRASKVRRSDLQTTVVQAEQLSAEHIGLIEYWAGHHELSPYHVSLGSAVASYVHDPAIHLVEVRQHTRLKGFGVLSHCSPSHAVLLQAFQVRAAGLPIGDAIYLTAIEWAQQSGCAHLHCGYSATPPQLAFKRDWAARCDQPPYRDAIFTDSRRFEAVVESGSFPWQQRLHLTCEDDGARSKGRDES